MSDAEEQAQEQLRLDAIYAQRFAEEDPAFAKWRREVWVAIVDGFLARWIPVDAVVLDFGCGQGEFLNAVTAARRVGADARDSARAFLDDGIEFLRSDGPRVPGLDDASIDVVFCSNVLEHLPDRESVTALLREFRRVLKPSGRLLVLGPNLRYTGAAYWDFFDHILPFTHNTLVEALATADFAAERLIPRLLPYTTVGARRTPPLLVKWYLRIPFAWRIMGAQFFCVARPAPATNASKE